MFAAGRNQLARQATSELAVSELAYNAKLNEIGARFQAQATNLAIVDVATAAVNGETISENAFASVQQLLQREVALGDMEYASLVGRDRTIIVSANANRQGQTFNPNNLVGTVLQTPEPIKDQRHYPMAGISQRSALLAC